MEGELCLYFSVMLGGSGRSFDARGYCRSLNSWDLFHNKRVSAVIHVGMIKLPACPLVTANLMLAVGVSLSEFSLTL